MGSHKLKWTVSPLIAYVTLVKSERSKNIHVNGSEVKFLLFGPPTFSGLLVDPPVSKNIDTLLV